MEQRPDPTPEGRLIAAAAKRRNLSIREAARRAGISYGRWRQVVAGYQNVSPGSFAAVHAPAMTIAKMATAVGLTPEQVESEGQRPDAAEIMRSDGADLSVPALPSDADLPPVLRGLDPREIEPFLEEVDRDLADALTGDRDPFDDFEAGILRNDRHTLDAKRVLLAIGRMYRAGVLPGQSRNRSHGTGLIPAPRRARLGNEVVSMR
jgi:transcriptional regulator with XRE-family HTH domain